MNLTHWYYTYTNLWYDTVLKQETIEYRDGLIVTDRKTFPIVEVKQSLGNRSAIVNAIQITEEDYFKLQAR